MSKNTGSRSQANPYQLEDLVVKLHRTPAGIAWRWRTELAILTILAAALWRLSLLITLTWACIVMAAFTGLVLGVPHSRRFLTARFWCVLVRHRIHRLCWEARLHTRSGRLPLVLRIWPTEVGECALVWCRAGVSAEDFADRTEQLRAACYARDARATRHRRWSHLVIIDIIRRDTLAASNTISSPLARLTARYQHHPALALVPDLPGDETDPAA
jgi:hypothetical protein